MTASMTTHEQRTHRNADEFMDEVQRYSDAACGIMIIRTREITRCANVLQDLAIREETDYRRWTCVEGWQRFASPIPGVDSDDHRRPLPRQGNSAVTDIKIDTAFEAVWKDNSQSGFFVMVHPHFHFDKPFIQQLIRNIKYRMTNRNIVAIVEQRYTNIPNDH